MTLIAKYRLKKDLPDLESGAIFEHREYDIKHPDRGNIGSGVLILGWLDGNCQQSWCGDTYVFPGQLSKNKEWFELIEKTSLKSQLENEVLELKREVKKLKNRLKTIE